MHTDTEGGSALQLARIRRRGVVAIHTQAVCEMRMRRDFTSLTLVVVKFIYDRSCTSCDCDIILLLCG